MSLESVSPELALAIEAFQGLLAANRKASVAGAKLIAALRALPEADIVEYIRITDTMNKEEK